MRNYLKIAAEKDVELTLHLRDDMGNSTVVAFIDLDGNTVSVKNIMEGGSGVFNVPLTQVSGVAFYEPERYGHYVGVSKDKLSLLYPEDDLEMSYFSRYHAIVLASFSDDFQLLRVISAIDVDKDIGSEGLPLGFDKGIDAIVHNSDIIYPRPRLR